MRPLDLMARWLRLYPLAALATLGLASSGCSFLFTKKAPASTENLPVTAPVKCTSSLVAPVVDSIIGTYQVVRTGYAISADDSAYNGAAITREMDIGFGVTLAALYLSSAVYGYVITNDCREFKAGRRPSNGEKYELPPPPGDGEQEESSATP